jgi:heptosyltransferase-2
VRRAAALQRIAVIAPNWLGDAVMCLPALLALRRQYPDAVPTVIARPAVAPIFRAADIGCETIALSPPVGVRALWTAWQLRRRLRAQLVVVFPNSFWSALLALCVGTRRLGYARDGRSLLLSRAVAPPNRGETPPHESFYYLELLRRDGLIPELPPEGLVRLTPDPQRVAKWMHRFPASRPLVAIHAGASFGTAKQWLPDRFAGVAAALASDGATVAFIGAPAERDFNESVRQMAIGRMETGAPAPVNLAGETSPEDVIALLACARLMICNDSGPMHVAAAVGTPVVAAFGPTNESETYPLASDGKLRLITASPIECRPCKLRECPIDHRCMTRIAVDDVLRAAQSLLASARGARRPNGVV